MNSPAVSSIRAGQALGLTWLLLLAIFSPLTLAGAAGSLPNGVAAGDTTQTSAVLWARATLPGQVTFEVSTDPSLTNPSAKSATVTDPLQPAKVEISGLTPGTTYYYRITDAANATGEGQFRTAAASGQYHGLRFGVSGDWRGELAPYPSIANADERDLDFFVEHGDTIVAGGATTSPDDFRAKHTEVYSTHHGLNTWADLRSSTAILATIDDNEIRNDFAGGAPPSSNPDFVGYGGNYINETELYENGLQAFQEYNPLRNEFYPNTGSDDRTDGKQKLYRFNTHGSDAAIFLLDTRSFRDEQLDVPTNELEAIAFLQDSLNDDTRTIVGSPQLAALKADLLQAQANGMTWKFILTPSPIQNLGLFKAEDRWEGYGAERTELLKFIGDNDIDNVVFVAAGLHGTLVNNLEYQEVAFGTHTLIDAFEVIVGPVAIDPPAGPFGPAIIDLAVQYGLMTPEEKATNYDPLSREEKDAFVEALMNDEIITPFPLEYDPLGLDGSGIDVTLLQGGYVAAHTYGWTEFEISPNTQALTVTTYGIDYYTKTELDNNPDDIINRTPEIVSQFVVNPKMSAEIGANGVYLPLVLKE